MKLREERIIKMDEYLVKLEKEITKLTLSYEKKTKDLFDQEKLPNIR